MWNKIQLAIGYKHNAFVHKFMNLNSKSKFYNIFFELLANENSISYFFLHKFVYFNY